MLQNYCIQKIAKGGVKSALLLEDFSRWVYF